MSSRRPIALLAVALVCTIGAGCSSDDGSSEDTAAATTEDRESTTDTASTADETDADSTVATEPGDTTAPASSAVAPSAETCALLLELHEYNDGFNAAAVSGDLSRLKTLDAEDTPRALEIYDQLASNLPGSEADVASARQLTEELSGLIAGADSYEDVTTGMFSLPTLTEGNDAVIAIDELAVARCSA